MRSKHAPWLVMASVSMILLLSVGGAAPGDPDGQPASDPAGQVASDHAGQPASNPVEQADSNAAMQADLSPPDSLPGGRQLLPGFPPGYAAPDSMPSDTGPSAPTLDTTDTTPPVQGKVEIVAPAPTSSLPSASSPAPAQPAGKPDKAATARAAESKVSKNASPQAPPVKTAKTPKSKIKPTVKFPEDLAPSQAASSSSPFQVVQPGQPDGWDRPVGINTLQPASPGDQDDPDGTKAHQSSQSQPSGKSDQAMQSGQTKVGRGSLENKPGNSGQNRPSASGRSAGRTRPGVFQTVPAMAAYYPRGYKPYVRSPDPMRRHLEEQAILHFNRANQLGQHEKLDEAAGEYRKAMTLNPDFADAHVGLSSVYMRRNDWENVMTETRKALDLKKSFLDPANILQAQYNLAAAYCAVDDYRRASRMYRLVSKTRHPSATYLKQFIAHSCKP